MVSIVASTSRSANSLAVCPSKIAPRSGTSAGAAAPGTAPLFRILNCHKLFAFSSLSGNCWIPLHWMEREWMRFMHNTYDDHASRETTPNRLKPPDYLCRDRRGKEHYRGSIAATAEPAG